MMRKKLIAFLLVSIVLSSIFFISTGRKTTAEECNDCNTIPTPPGNAEYCKMNCDSSVATPTIVASATTITPGGSITLHVDSGGLACPSYTWAVDDLSYSITSQTDADLENATLTANSGSCGGEYSNDDIVVTVTVTDNCRKTDTIKIRNTSGHWDNGTITCNNLNLSTDYYLEFIDEDKQYTIAVDIVTRTKDGACTGSENQTKGCHDKCEVYAQGTYPYDDMLADEEFNCARREGSSSYCDAWFGNDPIRIARTGIHSWVCSE